MSVLKILTYPDPVLNKKTEKVEIFDERLNKLLEDLSETMYACNGIGLAANQIGVLLSVIVVDIDAGNEDYDGSNLIKLVNPELVSTIGETRQREGCLSVPGMDEFITRYEKILVKGFNEKGEMVEINAEGLLAIALQHEIDHLEGMTIVERISRLKKSAYLKKLKKNTFEETLESEM